MCGGKKGKAPGAGGSESRTVEWRSGDTSVEDRGIERQKNTEK